MAPAALAADVLAELVREAPAEVRRQIPDEVVLAAKFDELLDQQSATSKDADALAALVDEVCGADRG